MGRGNPNWVKGVSGNPAGKPKGCAELQRAMQARAATLTDEMFDILVANARGGETAAALKVIALAGVKAEADAVIAVEVKQPEPTTPTMSINDLLKRASTSVTLS
jgi:hypothetical protein